MGKEMRKKETRKSEEKNSANPTARTSIGNFSRYLKEKMILYVSHAGCPRSHLSPSIVQATIQPFRGIKDKDSNTHAHGFSW